MQKEASDETDSMATETRMARFEEAYEGWTERQLTQAEAAHWLGVGDRTFRRWLDRYQEEGLEGLRDKRRSRGRGCCCTRTGVGTSGCRGSYGI